jgi:hypothetical protein
MYWTRTYSVRAGLMSWIHFLCVRFSTTMHLFCILVSTTAHRLGASVLMEVSLIQWFDQKRALIPSPTTTETEVLKKSFTNEEDGRRKVVQVLVVSVHASQSHLRHSVKPIRWRFGIPRPATDSGTCHPDPRSRIFLQRKPRIWVLMVLITRGDFAMAIEMWTRIANKADLTRVGPQLLFNRRPFHAAMRFTTLSTIGWSVALGSL